MKRTDIDAAASVRRRHALYLRLVRGLTFRQIGIIMGGMTRARAHQMVRKAIALNEKALKP